MKIETNGGGIIVLKEVFSGVLLETEEGNAIGICMRDDTLEINVLPKGEKRHSWWRVNMQDRTIEPELFAQSDSSVTDPDGCSE